MNKFIEFWPVLKRLLYYGINIKKYLILGSILLLCSSVSEVLNPILISYFIKNNFVNTNIFSYLKEIIFSYLILQIFSALLNYYQDIIFNKISIKIVQQLRYDVMLSTLKLPMDKFDQQPVGQLISRITNDTEVIKELYDTVITTLFKNIVLIIVTLITMFILEWRMASIAAIIFPMVFVVMLFYQKYSKPILRKMRIYISNIHNVFNEIINGIHVIQQFSQEKRFRESVKHTSELHYKTRIKILKLDGFLLRPLLSLFSTTILCSLIILFGLYPIGFFEIGTLYIFITYLGRLNEPLITITSQQSIFQQAIVSGERIFELINFPKQKYGHDRLHLKTGEINITNLNFNYENRNQRALKNINIFIPSKKFIAFVGNTGSGKSTLAKLLMGYYPITSGHIYLDKRKIESLSYNVIKKGLCIIQQDPIILNDTVLENLTLGKVVSTSKILKILKKVQLINLINSMPKGIYSLLGENGNTLSIGQKQLLSIARILLLNPKVLILDEATSNIDSNIDKQIKQILSLMQKKTTLIVITHKLSTIKNADKIIVFNNGKIVESGTHYFLINQKKYYNNMYKSQLVNH